MPTAPQAAPDRFFPHITPELYRLPSKDLEPPLSTATQRLLGLASRALTFRQKYWDQNLDTEARAARLLGLHKEAMRSELAGEFPRADFLWRYFHDEFSNLASRDEFWEELARIIGCEPSEMFSPTELRRRLTEEIFAETHLAFYSGYAGVAVQPPPKHRAYIHFEYVKELLPWMGVSGDSLVSLLRRPLVAQMSSFHRRGRWDDALRLSHLLAKYAPRHVACQEELARVYFAMAVGSLKNVSGVAARGDASLPAARSAGLCLKNVSGAAARDDADTLLSAIGQLEQLRLQTPYSLTIFRLLGHLYHLRSSKLAEVGLLSAALVEAQKALLFYPDYEDARRNSNELTTLMKRMQAEMNVTEEQVLKQPPRSLADRGRLLQAEVCKGFEPLNEYMGSPEALAIAVAYLLAQAHTLRQELGLPARYNDSEEQASSLLAAVGRVFAAAPADMHEAVSSWRSIAATHEELAGVDAATVHRFLRQQLFQLEDHPGTARSQAHPERVVTLPVSARKILSRPEPFGYWLLGRRNLGVKARAVAALLLIFLTGVVWAREARSHTIRDGAYLRIIEAADKQHYPEVLDGAETFLSHQPLAGEDGRKSRVLDYYDDALLHIVVQQDGAELSPEVAARLTRYRQLVGNTK